MSKISGSDTLRVLDYFGPNEYGWNQQKINFVMPENTLYLFLKISTQFEFSVNGIARLWVDGLRLAPL